MRKRSCVLLLAITMMSCSSAASAADAKTCDAYAKEATAKAQGIRQFNCGFDVNDPRWATDRNGHAAWCKTADKETVERESARRRGEIKLCRTCRAYANAAVAAAAGNARLGCGFDGPRWHDRAADHFAWCMALRVSAEANVQAAASNAGPAAEMENSTIRETADRVLAIEECRLRRPASRKPPPKT
jgi:hypothetical protein